MGWTEEHSPPHQRLRRLSLARLDPLVSLVCLIPSKINEIKNEQLLD